jgi:hypothetical protein
MPSPAALAVTHDSLDDQAAMRRRSPFSELRCLQKARVRAAFQPCSIVVRPTYDTSACASTAREIRNAVLA